VATIFVILILGKTVLLVVWTAALVVRHFTFFSLVFLVLRELQYSS
jgi:hypothetical protein